jgi:molybdopterin-guanine dinucleotide biosynthesis protein A
MNEIEGFVLNGGMSSRMGAPKGSLRIGPLTFAEHAANALLAVCDRVYVVGGEEAIDGVETILDVAWNGKKERASIFGLRSALLQCSTKYAAILACDMQFVTGDVISRLAADMSTLEKGQADAIIPSDKNGWLQPLCAIYERDRCRVAIDAYLMTGERQIRGLIGRLRQHRIENSKFADLENAENVFLNINTPADLDLAAEFWNKAHDPSR